MERPTKTEAIKLFLMANTHQDLGSLYNYNMECQVNVAQDGGKRVEGDFKGRQWHGWSDGVQVWKSFRIPYKAKTEPEYTDSEMSFDFSAHVEGIGMTGWDWVNKISRWVAFDFDAISGHSDKHSKKLSELEMEEVAERIASIPWTTLRRSTSGKGLHLYIFLLGVSTANHDEHASLARAILGQLSALTRYDFSSKVDCCGNNMWIFHRKMKGTNGLTLLKSGEVLEQIPFNWKDHIKVVTGRRRKTLPLFIENQKGDIDKWFDELSGQQSKIPLDEEHVKLIDWLRDNGANAWWDQDAHMMVTHTFHLKQAHEALALRGRFNTLAQGTDVPHDQNCFAFPARKGAWAVRRFTPGVAEDVLWGQDGSGWTHIFYNKDPDLKIAAKAFDGLEHPQGGYSFKHAELAKQAAELLGAKVVLPPWILTRKTLLKEHKDGRLVMEIEQSNDDIGLEGMSNWISERGKYKRVFDVYAKEPAELDVSAFDELVRHIVTPSGDDMGWMVRSDESWKAEPLNHVKHALCARGFNNKDVNLIIGTNVLKCWTLVNMPFQDEYPSGRQWNRNATQFRYRPTINIDNLTFPTWLSVLNHLGKNLDSAVKKNEWCVSNCILTGGDYLKCWIASLFQFPLEPLPYLFFFGESNAAKSTFHEALSLLVTHGVVRVDQALTSTFNGELANAILGVVEETDLKRNKQAYARIKDWVTARTLTIRAIYEAPYQIPNAAHFIQCQPKSTWIFTKNGPRQIKDLINKDCNLIVDGQIYPTKGFFYTGTKQLYKIMTRDGYYLEATEDHLILKSCFELKYWIKLMDLKIGDRISLNNHNNIHWSGEGDYEEGYILGWLYGDGSFRTRSKNYITKTNNPVLYFYEDIEAIPFIKTILNECNVLKASDSCFTIAGKQLKRLTEKFNFYSKKNIESLETTSSDFYEGFLSAVFDTDGSFSKRDPKAIIYQSNLETLQSIQRMLLRLGITSKINVCRKERKLIGPKNTLINAKQSYGLYITTQINLQRLYKRCAPNLIRKRNILKSHLNRRITKITDYVTEVISIEKSNIEETYDTIVPEIHAYDSNGIMVHNCSNEASACPIFPGDTRIVYINVDPIPEKDIIPKRFLIPKLEKEAPDFLAEILNLEIPQSPDRLNIPVVTTLDKKIAEEANRTLLQIFLDEQCYYYPGKLIKYSEFYLKFKEWLEPADASNWTKPRVGRELPAKFPKGRVMREAAQYFIGNISWTPPETVNGALPLFVRRDDTLIQESQ